MDLWQRALSNTFGQDVFDRFDTKARKGILFITFHGARGAFLVLGSGSEFHMVGAGPQQQRKV